jgi:hypothetical protein
MPFSFTCPHCGKQTLVPDEYYGQSGPCGGCGQFVTALSAGALPQPRPIGEDAGIRLLLPVGRSGWAIAAGYAGLISVLFLPAPLALLFGILALRDMKRHPEKHGMGRAIFGLIMGGIFSVFLVLAGIGITIAAIQGK